MELKPLSIPKLRTEPAIGLASWLLQLRWVAVAGQLLTISVVDRIFKVEVPMRPLMILISVTAITNLAFGLWLGGLWGNRDQSVTPFRGKYISILLLILDMLSLTALLYWTGGVANPFLFFYFVNLAIAGLILKPIWSTILTTIAILGVFWLLQFAPPLDVFQNTSFADEPFWGIRKQGLAIAFAASSIVVTFFMSMIMQELRAQEKELDEAHAQQLRSQRLEALATLAAGAGHELASPLSTIAVVAKELSRSFEKIDAPASIRNDVELIRSELERCREILSRMKSSAGEAAAEQLDPVSMQELMDETLSGLREPKRVRIEASPSVMGSEGEMPVQALSLALRNLLQNAIDASPPNETVLFRIIQTANGWELEVIDKGDGMQQETLLRIGEPFFTTKEPGHGMGLGVFLSRNVITRLCGTLSFTSEKGKGTSCKVFIPFGR